MRHEKQASYASPVAATIHGRRHILCLMRQGLVSVNPANGSIQNQTNAGGPISLPPIVANKTLYVLTDSGRLIAYR